jgi:hypothetical protein
MFRSLGPSLGLITITTPIQIIIQVAFEISLAITTGMICSTRTLKS